MENRFAHLQRQVRGHESTLNRLHLELEELRLNEIREQRTFEVFDRAAVPKRAYFPNPVVNMLIAGPLALCVGIFYAMAMTYSSRKDGGGTNDVALLEWRKPESYFIASELMSVGLLTPDQVWHVLSILRRQSGWRFLQTAIKLGYITERNVEQVIQLKNLILSSQRNPSEK